MNEAVDEAVDGAVDEAVEKVDGWEAVDVREKDLVIQEMHGWKMERVRKGV